ncbi:hypothetical protein PTKIN_Ptkin13bG0098600 [Pterospermum kingtungense]
MDTDVHRDATHLHRAYLSFMMFMLLLTDINVAIYKELSDIFKLESVDNLKKPTHDQQELEVYITYLLLFGALIADAIALISHFFSNWTLYWLTTPNTWRRLPEFLHTLIVLYLKQRRKSMHEVKFMGQYRILLYCFQTKVNECNAAMSQILRVKSKLFSDNKQRGWVEDSNWALVSDELKLLIFSRLQAKREKYQQNDFKFSRLSTLASNRAFDVLKAKVLDIYKAIKWSIKKVNLAHNILLWHIATDILFYYNHREKYKDSSDIKVSKRLSYYMMHLLVKRSFMLHSGIISKLRYRDTCSQAKDIFAKQIDGMRIKDLAEATKKLLFLENSRYSINADVSNEDLDHRSKSAVFYEGLNLVKKLQSFVTVGKFGRPEKP